MNRKQKFCSNCGTVLNMNDRFCEDCGFDTQSDESPALYSQPVGGNATTIAGPSRTKASQQVSPQVPLRSGILEFWRRMVLLLAIFIGIPLFFYVTPAVVSVTAVNWEKEQAEELNSSSGFVSEEKKRLSELPLEIYIAQKTEGKVTQVESDQWRNFFTDVQLASNGQHELSAYGSRVSEEDKDPFWQALGPVAVFFKPDEISYSQWGLISEDLDSRYISTEIDGVTVYLMLRYHDYNTSISAMHRPYRVAPAWLFHPYRNTGIGILIAGLLAYLFLPRRKKEPEDISYSTGSMLAGDLTALILLLPFFGLPFLINGGTVQAVSGMWIISAVLWFLATFCILLLYLNAWYASFRIVLTEESLSLVTYKRVKQYRFADISEANLVMLRNPGWFRKLFLALAFLSLIGGRSSPQPAGSALLAASAAYGGLEIKSSGGKPLYIWYANQNGGVIIRHFDRVLEAIEGSGKPINSPPREIEGFSMFM